MLDDIFEKIETPLSNGLMTVVNPDPWIDRIESLFPIGFNRIDWEKVVDRTAVFVLESPRSITSDDLSRMLFSHKEQIAAWLDEVDPERCTSAIWVGDTSEKALMMNTSQVLDYFAELMCLPQHSYFISQNESWCLNYVMEGQLFFGRSNKSPA